MCRQEFLSDTLEMFHVKPDDEGFAERIAFLRWVRHLDAGEPPSNEEIAKAAEHTGQWLTGLLKTKKAPTKGADHHALGTFFSIDYRWLIYGLGEAPRPDLWGLWRAARDANPVDARSIPLNVGQVDPAKVRPSPWKKGQKRRRTK